MKAAGNRLSTKRTRKHTTRLRWGAVHVRTMQTKISNQSGELDFEGADPTKPYEVCETLRDHGISLCAMSEVRWKGQGTLEAGEYLYILSGLPEEAPVSLYGVAIALDPAMQRAWRLAGAEVDFSSERLLKIKLQIEGRLFHVISVYAPTFRAPEREKDAFYAQLEILVNSCKANEELVIMGDFNARVGTRSRDVEGWDGQQVDPIGPDLTLGDFGLPELNDNGRLLLDFCRSRRGQSLRIMDTYYQHKVYGTWQHNRTKIWHHIDHILTSAKTAKLVTDVRVMPGLDFDTDHRLMRIDLRVIRVCKQPWGRHRKQFVSSMRRIPNLDVAKMKDPVVVEELNRRFDDVVGEGLTDDYELWSYGLRCCAEATLGFVKATQRPQWQLDNSVALAALAHKKQEAFRQRNSSDAAAAAYKTVCKHNRKQIRQILNLWWTEQAHEIQQAVNRKDPNHQYQGFRQLRRVFHTGRRPPAKVRDRQGNLLCSRPARVARWKEHFSELLNVNATVNADISRLSAVAVDHDLQKLPVFAETLAAVASLKRHKATGPDGISAEILQSLPYAALRSMHEQICQVWKGLAPVPKEWKASYLVPLPKKGDLTKCEKWRGVLLTAVPGKVFSKIMNGRLVKHFEQQQVLPETQCGFRAGRGTTDMVFTLRMAIEVARAKHVPLYVMFVDLMKAYDSVSRAGMWQVLKRKGIPDQIVSLVQQFYEGKQAQVFAEGVL